MEGRATSAGGDVDRTMRTMPFSELRRDPASAIDAVNADREPLIITRRRGRPAAVLLSADDFASLQETA